MKKKLFYVACFASAMLCMTACSSDDDIVNKEIPVSPETKDNIVTLTGTISLGGGEITRALGGTDGKTVTWADGDKILVQYEQANGTFTSVVGDITINGSDSHKATFTAQLTNPKEENGRIGLAYPGDNVTAGSVYNDFTFKGDYTTGQDGTLATINSSKLDYAKTTGNYTMTITTNGNTKTAELKEDANLKNQFCLLKLNLQYDANCPFFAKTVTITAGSDTYTITQPDLTNDQTKQPSSSIYVILPGISSQTFTFKAKPNKSYYRTIGTLSKDLTVEWGDVIGTNNEVYRLSDSSGDGFTELTYTKTTNQAATLNIGKYYESTLSFKDPFIPGAIVAYVGSAIGNGDANGNETYPFKNLAIAVTDASSAAWGSNEYTDDCFSGITTTNSSFSYQRTNLYGIAQTDILTGSHNSHTHNAATNAKNYSHYTPKGTGVSSWFLPSSGQWFKVFTAAFDKSSPSYSWNDFGYCLDSGGSGTSEGYKRWNAVNTLFTNVGTGAFNSYYYWTSSLYQVKADNHDAEAIFVYFGISVKNQNTTTGGIYMGYQTEGSSYHVRPFFAF